MERASKVTNPGTELEKNQRIQGKEPVVPVEGTPGVDWTIPRRRPPDSSAMKRPHMMGARVPYSPPEEEKV